MMCVRDDDDENYSSQQIAIKLCFELQLVDTFFHLFSLLPPHNISLGCCCKLNTPHFFFHFSYESLPSSSKRDFCVCFYFLRSQLDLLVISNDFNSLKFLSTQKHKKYNFQHGNKSLLPLFSLFNLRTQFYNTKKAIF